MWALGTLAAGCLLGTLASASSVNPPTLPLFVRNPYLNTHLGNARNEPWTKWPMFWNGQEMGFGVMASVPNSNYVYPLVGRPHDSLHKNSEHYTIAFPKYLGANFDASTTNLSYAIPSPSDEHEDVLLTLSFFSPITPTSTLRQSIPASYIEVIVEGGFDVDVYIDLNGQWVSGDRGAQIQWELNEINFEQAPPLRTWKLHKAVQQSFTEFQERAEWGQLHFTGPAELGFQSGTSALLRHGFAKNGRLQNANDDRFRGIMDEEPVFAFHTRHDVSALRDASNRTSTLFTIAHVRSEIVQFASARGLTYMKPLWAAYFFTEPALVTFHYADFEHAKALATNYSTQLTHDARKAEGQEYADVLAYSARQVIGGTEFGGTPDDPLLFVKEISSDGNCQTVDVIFPSFPFFLYTNPRWLAYMLEPLLEHQLSGQYPNKYSMHDLGFHYPNLTGHPLGKDEYMPLEECGDMIIMGLSLVNSLRYKAGDIAQSIWSKSGKNDGVVTLSSEGSSPFALDISSVEGDIRGLDDSWGGESKGESQARIWLENSYRIWQQWTEYLIEEALYPKNQLSTDDFAGWLPLHSNLALKGIVGIRAMAELADFVGDDDGAKRYHNISETYLEKWLILAITRDGNHAKLAYDWYGSWTTIYTLFADTISCFHTQPEEESSSTDGEFVLSGNGGQKPLKPGDDDKSSGNFIPTSLYVNQSAWYWNSMQKYGLPLDSRHLYTKSDWEFEAAAVASPSVRRDILFRVGKWLNETISDLPFTDLYHTEGFGNFGAGNRFAARPVIGGHFAYLALNRACKGHALDGFKKASEVGSLSESWIWSKKEQEAYKKEWTFLDERFIDNVNDRSKAPEYEDL